MRLTAFLALGLSFALLTDQVEAQKQNPGTSRQQGNRRPGQGGKKPGPKKPAKPKSNLPSFEGARAKIRVAPISGARRSEAQARADEIDRLVDAQLKKAGVSPNGPTTDTEFVRRIYLDVVGRIPTAAETMDFLKSRDPQKRERLIDKLLASPGHASHTYNYWADVLRLVDQSDGNTYLRPYLDWVKEQLRANRPYDEMVRDMLTATGKVWENPPAGYVLRDAGMPLDNLNNTVRVFLGTRIGCAQCHDHPFDRWTQKEFYELAALTSGVSDRIPGRAPKGVKDVPTTIRMKYNDVATDTREGRTARRLFRMNRMAVWENPNRRLKYPGDYGYDNADANGVVRPNVIFGKMPAMSPGLSRREVFADWLVSKQNPRFAKTVANRLWKRAFGIGVIEPVDDMMDDTVPSNPALMAFLEKEMKALDFDLREFERSVYLSRAYQRKATLDDVDPEKPYHFPGPVLRRMTAEQAWDSLMTLTVPDPDTIVRQSDEQYVSIVNLTAKTSIPELMTKAKQFGDLGKERAKQKRNRTYRNTKEIGGNGIELARASELPQPVPANHFLRQFGQSDREIIGDSSTDGTVPQLLTMFNGPVTHMMLDYGTVLYVEITSQKDMDDAVDAVFLSLLNRRPTRSEKELAMKEIRARQAAGVGDVVWALLNTREFLFIR